MLEEMRMTDDQILRMNISLGVSGEVFKEMNVFSTDFMAIHDHDGEDEDDSQDDEFRAVRGQLGVSRHLKNSLKPVYIHRINDHHKIVGFNSDIDNFPGVPNIENFLIAAMTDEDDQL